MQPCEVIGKAFFMNQSSNFPIPTSRSGLGEKTMLAGSSQPTVGHSIWNCNKNPFEFQAACQILILV